MTGRWLLAILLLAAPAFGQGSASSLRGITVSQLPAPVAGSTNVVRVYVVRDGADASDCTVGGGSTRVLCYDTGSAYLNFSGEQGVDTTCLDAGVTCLFAGSATEGGPATTALALNANPANCPAGQWAAGIAADGTAEGCTPDATGTDDQAAPEVGYTPTTPADWSVAPDDVAGGLDTLAGDLAAAIAAAVTSLGMLSDVDLTGAAPGDVLVYPASGTTWAVRDGGCLDSDGDGTCEIQSTGAAEELLTVAANGTTIIGPQDASGTNPMALRIDPVTQAASNLLNLDAFDAEGGSGPTTIFRLRTLSAGSYRIAADFRADVGMTLYNGPGSSRHAQVANVAPSLTAAIFRPDGDDTNTGWGGDGSDTLSAVAGGSSVLQASSVADEAVLITPASATQTGLTVQGAAGQTANLFEAQDSTGTVLASVSAAGAVKAADYIQAGPSTATCDAATEGSIRVTAAVAGVSATVFERCEGTAADPVVYSWTAF